MAINTNEILGVWGRGGYKKEMWKTSAPACIQMLCKEIDRLNAQIEDLEGMLEPIQGDDNDSDGDIGEIPITEPTDVFEELENKDLIKNVKINTDADTDKKKESNRSGGGGFFKR